MSVNIMRFLLLVFLIVGCGNLPTEPPPIAHFATYEEAVKNLKTPSHVVQWLNSFANYDLKYNIGWEKVSEGKDLAWALSESLWENYVNGTSRGVCGQMAAMFVVCARTHGYNTGVLVWYLPGAGHAEAWIQEGDGYITMTSNDELYYKKYKSIDEMKCVYREMFDDVTFYNAYWKKGER